MGDSLPFVEESMHRKTRKSRIPIHRFKFLDPNMNFRRSLMEKASIWLKKKRRDSLFRRRAIVSTRQSSLKDDEVLKISQMPSLPTTDAVPFNNGWYEKVEVEGLIPLPSVIKCGSKFSFDGEKEGVEWEVSRRKNICFSHNKNLQAKHRIVSMHSSKSNTFLGGDGQLLASTTSDGMSLDEHHMHTDELLNACKEQSKILYFGNMECRQNMEDSIAFFENYKNGNYRENDSLGEDEKDSALKGNSSGLERNKSDLEGNLERLLDEREMNVDGFCGDGDFLIHTHGMYEGRKSRDQNKQEGNQVENFHNYGDLEVALESQKMQGNLEIKEIFNGEMEAKKEGGESSHAGHVDAFMMESLLDGNLHNNVGSNCLGSGGPNSNDFMTKNLAQAGGPCVKLMDVHIHNSQDSGHGFNKSNDGPCDMDLSINAKGSPFLNNEDILGNGPNPKVILVSNGQDISRALFGSFMPSGGPTFNSLVDGVALMLNANGTKSNLGPMEGTSHGDLNKLPNNVGLPSILGKPPTGPGKSSSPFLNASPLVSDLVKNPPLNVVASKALHANVFSSNSNSKNQNSHSLHKEKDGISNTKKVWDGKNKDILPNSFANVLNPPLLKDPVPSSSSSPVHTAPSEPMDASFEQDDLLNEEDVIEVDSDDGATAQFLTRDPMPSQIALDRDPENFELREEHSRYLSAYNEACLDEERFLIQKAKIDWLREGDKNSAFFHKSVKGRASRNRIDTIQDADGRWVDSEEVPNLFVTHFQNFLGSTHSTSSIRDPLSLFSNKLSEEQAASMLNPLSDDEIKNVLFQMGDDKAPGPDGFTAKFFKSTWDIVGTDVCAAVRDSASAQILKDSLSEFSAVSGLYPSAAKSEAFFCNVESMHRKTRKSRIPIHRFKFLDPNMNFQRSLMEKASIWLKKKRRDSLFRRRVIVSTRQSSLKDDEVLKISQMPSLPATDAVPFNNGWYEKVEVEGLIPLPSVIKCGSKFSFDGEKEGVEWEVSRRKNICFSHNKNLQAKHGIVSMHSSKSNTFLGGDGQLLASTTSDGMSLDEHHMHTDELLNACKEQSKILYFGNMECRQNMEDSIAFFENYKNGNYRENDSLGEDEKDSALKGNSSGLERNKSDLEGNLERLLDEREMNVDGFCGDGDFLIHTHGMYEGRKSRDQNKQEGNQVENFHNYGDLEVALESQKMQGNLEIKEIFNGEMEAKKEGGESSHAGHVDAFMMESLLDGNLHNNVGSNCLGSGGPNSNDFMTKNLTQAGGPCVKLMDVHIHNSQDSGHGFNKSNDGPCDMDLSINAKGSPFLNNEDILGNGPNPKVILVSNGQDISRAPFGSFMPSGGPTFNSLVDGVALMLNANGTKSNLGPMEGTSHGDLNKLPNNVGLPSILGKPPTGPVEQQKKDNHPAAESGKPANDKKKSKSKVASYKEYRPIPKKNSPPVVTPPSSIPPKGSNIINIQPSPKPSNPKPQPQTKTKVVSLSSNRFSILEDPPLLKDPVPSSSSSPVHTAPSEPMDASFEQDDLLNEEDVIEVDSDDGATAQFLTRDPMPSQVNPVSTLEPERMDSTPTPVS
ncbi:hypothetical protein L6452_04433 [Arctium lappa]|uniref:Uncharacterized protein n=1 Tax=Arctium lappa TaxID=4217 RepID=A0ACB9EDP6_ARCLA|nr:hypothetical protein L6452_04433 [Arctium lappa]